MYKFRWNGLNESEQVFQETEFQWNRPFCDLFFTPSMISPNTTEEDIFDVSVAHYGKTFQVNWFEKMLWALIGNNGVNYMWVTKTFFLGTKFPTIKDEDEEVLSQPLGFDFNCVTCGSENVWLTFNGEKNNRIKNSKR